MLPPPHELLRQRQLRLDPPTMAMAVVAVVNTGGRSASSGVVTATTVEVVIAVAPMAVGRGDGGAVQLGIGSMSKGATRPRSPPTTKHAYNV